MTRNGKLPLQTAIKLKKQSFSDWYVTKRLLELYPDVLTSESETNNIISEARDFLKKETESNINRIFQLHRSRYRKIINQLLSVKELDEKQIGSTLTYNQWLSSRNKKIKACHNAINFMSQLEHLLQITNDNTLSIAVNEKIDVNVQQRKPKWDVDKLNFEEQLRLYEIFKICKGSNELLGVKEVIREAKVETIDIEHEVLEQANIEQIKHKEIEPAPYVSPVINFNPTSLLKQRLKEIAAKEIARVGGKLSPEEKQYFKN